MRAVLSLVLPTFTTSRAGPEFSPLQLGFAATASLALYALFLVVQTVRHPCCRAGPGAGGGVHLVLFAAFVPLALRP